ncbi:hypothetical protein [Xenorhabdus santafensis]|uniref:hypothetical protein n=1 Tax=Xenorhabdus santafensis TaxID=2582833 RepID=UPI0029E7DC53|nr:hypothetical protein [Xenorhabdus sp. 12]
MIALTIYYSLFTAYDLLRTIYTRYLLPTALSDSNSLLLIIDRYQQLIAIN